MFTGIGFNVKNDFKKVSRATLDIKVKQLNFIEDGGRRAAEIINSWVANKTDGKIDRIISPGACHMSLRTAESFISRLKRKLALL